MKYELLHEDEDLLVVSKPSGLLSIPGRSGHSDNLRDQLERKFGSVLTVHRLDRETSGVICFARNEAAHRDLSIQFERHSADKFYLALVEGIVHHEEGEINKPIGEHASIPGKMCITNRGKPSLTFYRVLERFGAFTLVEALLKTGRTHQIRIHFQSIGYPLATDALYGRREALYLSEIKGKGFKLGKYAEEERPLLHRSALHAYRLRINHPRSGERMTFVAPPPKDFEAVLRQLRKFKT